MTLVDKLIEKQQTENLTDRPFAKQLGVTHVQWFNIRKRHRKIGAKTITGVLRLYPDLQEDVLTYITNDTDKSAA